ncbi:hypothetical protein CLHUN_37230 [Ruminiclostridium hungatei]|uniref:Uncharacterized protein n=1 Tax=Ruminiclostridium hungatei TaxID=48256 RepID=A0A1V4SG20_RUMHU|nr:hypothetical protein [Ruminiclostridium hungatei]OPX42425.1 hypothetical protein CLHUN_37230 [Ruminiclostridium hungatei]
MTLKNSARPVFLLIAVLMLLQLMPVNIDYADESQIHTQNSQVFISAKFVYTNVFFIHNENQKTLVHKVQINNTYTYTPQVTGQKLSQTGQATPEVPFDYRKLIRQSISEHFNGSKFKESLPVI